MKWIVDYCQTPTNFHTWRRALVEAPTDRDARLLIEEKLTSQGWRPQDFDVLVSEKLEAPPARGRIISDVEKERP